MVLIILSKNYLGILVGYNIEFTIKTKRLIYYGFSHVVFIKKRYLTLL